MRKFDKYYFHIPFKNFVLNARIRLGFGGSIRNINKGCVCFLKVGEVAAVYGVASIFSLCVKSHSITQEIWTRRACT